MIAEYTFAGTRLAVGEGIHYRVRRGSADLTFRTAAQLWLEDPPFQGEFIGLLRQCPFRSYRWECPVLSAEYQDRPFEFVLLDAPDLSGRAADTMSFAEPLADAGQAVASFFNLGGDALMVVPQALADTRIYVDLAAFSRGAPMSQQRLFWSRVGECVLQRLAGSNFWLSTAGGGVAWLHVRLDRQPKYYHYAPYRRLDYQHAGAALNGG